MYKNKTLKELNKKAKRSNVLVLGAADSGKTYYVIEPNLMDSESSFIIHDLNGKLYKKYHSFFVDRGYKVKTISPINVNEISELLSADEMDIASIGTEKTALFCIIPLTNNTADITKVLYSQILKKMFYLADYIYRCAFPVHVRFIFDDFMSVALSDNYCPCLSVMKRINMSSIMSIQSIVQLKEMAKETYEWLAGTCEVVVYMGGNCYESIDYISKLFQDDTSLIFMGKKHDSLSGTVHDKVKLLNREKCIIKIWHNPPVIVDKTKIQKIMCKNKIVKELNKKAQRSNVLVLGAADSGKSFCNIKQNLIDSDASLKINDLDLKSEKSWSNNEIKETNTDILEDSFDKEKYLQHLSEEVFTVKYKERSTGKVYEINPRINDDFYDSFYRIMFRTGEYVLISGELPDKWQ